MNARDGQLAGAPAERSRWIALYVLCVGMLMIVLDVTVVNVALPSIQDDLHFSSTDLAWVVNAYLIAFGGLLLLAGRFGDLVGRRRVFLAGVCVFTAASLLCGLAQSEALLVGARFVQGVGGAMTSAVILGMIVTMFPEPREQAKAIGVYAFVASAGGAVGLVAGRRADPVDQLALDLLRQRPDRARHGDARQASARAATRPSVSPREPTCRAQLLITCGADVGRLHDRQAGGRTRLGRVAHPALGAACARAAGGFRRARGERRQPARAAAGSAIAQPRLGER